MRINAQSSVLVIGQHLTSRTEAIRDFLLSRVKNVYVIALASPFLNKIENHLFIYEENGLKRHFVFRHSFVEKIGIYGLKVFAAFAAYLFDIIKALFLSRRRFDICIGVARFPGLIAAGLKLLFLSKSSIYYSIDYYHVSRKEKCFNKIFVAISDIAEGITIFLSDEVWDITRRIAKARALLRNVKSKKYLLKHRIAPLGYSNSFFREKEPAERHSLVFAGVVARGQGLELLLDILPELNNNFPDLKIKVIGTGQYLPAFKQMITERELDKHFIIYGFIEDVDKMLDIISGSAVGVSLWDDEVYGPNSYFGDPGKTKLYSVCGLPVIVSDKTVYSKVIRDNKCGIAIKYNRDQLLSAITALMSDEAKYKEFKKNAVKTAKEHCSSDRIFSNVFQL